MCIGRLLDVLSHKLYELFGEGSLVGITTIFVIHIHFFDPYTSFHQSFKSFESLKEDQSCLIRSFHLCLLPFHRSSSHSLSKNIKNIPSFQSFNHSPCVFDLNSSLL